MKVFAIASMCLLVASCAWAAPSVQDNQIDSESTFTRVARYLGSCFESDDMTTCLAVKGITALNRAARSNNIELVNGVTFKRCVLFNFIQKKITNLKNHKFKKKMC